jgi:hypothetical protein
MDSRVVDCERPSWSRLKPWRHALSIQGHHWQRKVELVATTRKMLTITPRKNPSFTFNNIPFNCLLVQLANKASRPFFWLPRIPTDGQNYSVLKTGGELEGRTNASKARDNCPSKREESPVGFVCLSLHPSFFFLILLLYLLIAHLSGISICMHIPSHSLSLSPPSACSVCLPSWNSIDLLRNASHPSSMLCGSHIHR